MKAGKKQVILGALVLALSVAVYLNWQFAKSGSDFTTTDSLSASGNYGDAEYVNGSGDGSSKSDEELGEKEETSAPVEKGEEYFAESRTNRQKNRDEALDKLQKSLKDTTISEEEKKSLTNSLSYMVKAVETEGKIESLIKAKGYSDCLVYINNEKADAVVKTDGLNEDTANQIKEIIIREAGVKAENITITEVK